MDMLSNYLSCIDFVLREDEELTAVLKVVHSVCHCCARLHTDERSVGTACHVALVWLVVLEAMCHDCLSLACCEYVGTKSYDASRRDFELYVDAIIALGFH